MYDKYANFFSRLATLAESGTGLTEAFEMLQNSESWSISRGIKKTMMAIHQGYTLAESLEKSELFEPFEVQMLKAGEEAGRLPEICHRLSEHRERRAQRIRNILMKMAYPTFLIHLAILGPSLFVYVKDGPEAYTKVVIPALLILYAIILTPFAIIQLGSIFKPFGKIIDYTVLSIPVLGGCILKYRLAHTITVLQGLYSSGVTIPNAVEQVIDVTKNQALRAIFVRIYNRLKNGENFTVSVLPERKLPKYLGNMIATGEKTGKLDESLLKARNFLDVEAETAIKMLVGTLNTVIFLAAAIFVGYKVVSLYSSIYTPYIEQFNSIRNH